MCLESCCKKEFVPRKKRVGPYKPVNAYTQSPSTEQIITIVIGAVQLILHSIFIVPPLDDIRKEILWVLLGFHYALLIVVGYDYIHLTTFDPVDRMVSNNEMAEKFRYDELTFCILCDSNVKRNSHHCFKCNRCTQQFDHHCKFLNNCIGGLNYQSFFRLLSIFTLYNFNVIGQSIWVLRQNFDNPDIAFEGNQWGVLTLLVLSVLVVLTVGALLAFHCYISVCEMTTTLNYNYPEKRMKSTASTAPNKVNVNIFEPPTSANRLTRNQQKHVV